MTLDEAIKKLLDLRAGDLELGRLEAAEVELLGIEALKRLKNQRNVPIDISFVSLPGETKE